MQNTIYLWRRCEAMGVTECKFDDSCLSVAKLEEDSGD